MNKIPNFDKDMDFVLTHSLSYWIVANYKKAYDAGKKSQVNRKWAEGCNYILKFENLEENVMELSEELGLQKPIEIPVMNVTEGKENHYRHEYSREARKILEYLLQHELVLYNYSF